MDIYYYFIFIVGFRLFTQSLLAGSREHIVAPCTIDLNVHVNYFKESLFSIYFSVHFYSRVCGKSGLVVAVNANNCTPRTEHTCKCKVIIARLNSHSRNARIPHPSAMNRLRVRASNQLHTHRLCQASFRRSLAPSSHASSCHFFMFSFMNIIWQFLCHTFKFNNL